MVVDCTKPYLQFLASDHRFACFYSSVHCLVLAQFMSQRSVLTDQDK